MANVQRKFLYRRGLALCDIETVIKSQADLVCSTPSNVRLAFEYYSQIFLQINFCLFRSLH